MGNRETIGRGFVQFTSAGSGISHSEYNAERRPGTFSAELYVGHEYHSQREKCQPRMEGKLMYAVIHAGGKDVHFLQIWAKPDRMNLTPAYQTLSWGDAAKWDTLAHIITPKVQPKDKTISINQDFNMWAGIVSGGRSVTHSLVGPEPGAPRRAYLHVPMTQAGEGVTLVGKGLNGQEGEHIKLAKGDGAFIEAVNELTITGHGGPANEGKGQEFVLFDFA